MPGTRRPPRVGVRRGSSCRRGSARPVQVARGRGSLLRWVDASRPSAAVRARQSIKSQVERGRTLIANAPRPLLHSCQGTQQRRSRSCRPAALSSANVISRESMDVEPRAAWATAVLRIPLPTSTQAIAVGVGPLRTTNAAVPKRPAGGRLLTRLECAIWTLEPVSESPNLLASFDLSGV